MPVQITCQQCGTGVTVPPSRAQRRKFCSHLCRSQWMAANLTGEKAPRYGRKHTAKSKAKMSRNASSKPGPANPGWKGGRYLSRGYVYVSLMALPMNEQEMFAPMATRSGGKYIPEHRLVVARQLGRPLLSTEIVHHVNGVKSDNRPANLEHHDSNSSHRMKHAQVDAEMFRLRRENDALRALLLRFCAVSALPDGGTTSR